MIGSSGFAPSTFRLADGRFIQWDKWTPVAQDSFMCQFVNVQFAYSLLFLDSSLFHEK